jgi:VCBS repeat protein
VLLRNTGFTYAPHVDYGAGVPFSVAIADIDGDGKPDLVTPDNNANSVNLLMGRGDGTFSAAGSEYLADGGPQWVAIGDFDGSGHPDVATANAGFSTISVLLNSNCIPTAVDPGLPQVTRVAVLTSEPNPFRSGVTIRFALPAPQRVDVDVFDVAGRKVAALLERSALAAGEHTVRWEPRGAGRGATRGGLYMIRIRAGDETAVARVLRVE